MVIELDLVKLNRWGLNINEYLTLLLVYKEYKGEELPFYSTVECINRLKKNEWIELSDNEEVISLTKKALKIVEEDEVNFDELFDIYPFKTPEGRILHTKNKEQAGTLTRDYKFLRDKYIKRIKSIDLHNNIIKATKIMLNSKRKRGELEYLPKLETYINQSRWEEYMHLIDKHEMNASSITGENIERL